MRKEKEENTLGPEPGDTRRQFLSGIINCPWVIPVRNATTTCCLLLDLRPVGTVPNGVCVPREYFTPFPSSSQQQHLVKLPVGNESGMKRGGNNDFHKFPGAGN